MAAKQIPIDDVTPIQLRVATDPQYVEDLAQLLIDPNHRNEVPEIECITDGVHIWCWDGVHRLLAAREAGLAKIRAFVSPGTEREAILKAAGANATHGLRRTNDDKHKAIQTVLAMDQCQSDREIARICNVSHTLVANVRSGKVAKLNAKSGNIATNAPSPLAVSRVEPGAASDPPAPTPLGAGASHTDDDVATDGQEADACEEAGETDQQERPQDAGHDAHFESLRKLVLTWWAGLNGKVSKAAVCNWLQALSDEIMEDYQ